MKRSHIVSAVALGSMAALAAACSSEMSGPNAFHLTLSFATAANRTTTGAAGASTDLTQTVGANTLVITKAQVVMKKVELSSTATADCTAEPEDAVAGATLVSAHDMEGGEGSECNEVRADPAVVDLPVDASVTTSFVSTVPAGTYQAFEAKIHVVRGSSPAATAFLAANPAFAGVSVHVDGTYNAVPFSYDGHAVARIEVPLDPPVTVAASGMNVTVNVDLGTWFVDGSGGLIDPNSANSGGANELLVNHNIHESFKAFEDDDHDGHEDHH